MYENLRMSYEKSSAHFGRSYSEIFKQFKNLVGSPQQCTRYGHMLVLDSPHVVAKLVNYMSIADALYKLDPK